MKRSRLSRKTTKSRNVRLGIVTTYEEVRDVGDELLIRLSKIREKHPRFGEELLEKLDISDEYLKALAKHAEARK